MGKTPKPLKILVTEPELLEHPDIVELAAKGHTFEPLAQECDAVIGEKAWLFLSKWSKMAEVVQTAWARVYPGKDK